MTLYKELYDEIEKYKNDNILKKRYLDYISNTKNSLNDRWKMFRHAPSSFKENETWVVHFETENLLESGEIIWFDDFYKDRYTTVYLIDIIDQMKEKPKKYSKEFITSFKEEILQKNLESFIYDW
jgi:hypothetical protein